MNEIKPVLWNRNFIQCCISYFLMSYAFYMIMPTMPVFLVEEMGIDPSKVGLALSSYTVGLLFIRPLSGYIVDAVSRKPLYLFSFFMFSIMFFGYLFAATILMVMAVRFLQGGFMGLTSVAGNTIAIDVIPSKRRGEGMGFYGMTLNLSMCLAPLLAVYLYEERGFNVLVLVAAVIALIGVFTVTLIKYPKREKVDRPPFSFDRFILVKALPSVPAYLLTAIPYGMIVSFVVLYGKEIDVVNPGYFFIYFAIGVGLARMISGKLIDRGKVHHVSIVSLVLLTCAFGVFATFHNQTIFFVSAFMIGLSYGINVPAFQYIFVNVAPHSMRGTATSTYLTSFDIGVGSGTLIAGYVASVADLSTAYLIGAGCCVLSVFCYICLAKPHYERNKLIP